VQKAKHSDDDDQDHYHPMEGHRHTAVAGIRRKRVPPGGAQRFTPMLRTSLFLLGQRSRVWR
jgi:hypothetical protein